MSGLIRLQVILAMVEMVMTAQMEFLVPLLEWFALRDPFAHQKSQVFGLDGRRRNLEVRNGILLSLSY